MEAFDALGMRVCHAWGMTEPSLPARSCPAAGPAARWARRGSSRTASPRAASRPVSRPPHRSRRRAPPLGRQSPPVSLEVRGNWIAGAYYNGPGTEPAAPRRPSSARSWLAEDRRRRRTIARRLPLTLTDRAKDVIKSGGGVDLLRRAGERPDVPPGRRRGRRGRRARRQVGRAPLATVVLKDGASVGFRTCAPSRAEDGKIAKLAAPGALDPVIEAVPRRASASSTRKVHCAGGEYADGGLDVTRLDGRSGTLTFRRAHARRAPSPRALTPGGHPAPGVERSRASVRTASLRPSPPVLTAPCSRPQSPPIRGGRRRPRHRADPPLAPVALDCGPREGRGQGAAREAGDDVRGVGGGRGGRWWSGRREATRAARTRTAAAHRAAIACPPRPEQRNRHGGRGICRGTV